MTDLRRDAMTLLEAVPEEKLIYLVEIMKDMSSSSTTENSASFRKLMRLRRRISNLNDSPAGWREDKHA